MAPTLGYWDIRGVSNLFYFEFYSNHYNIYITYVLLIYVKLGQPIRLLLAYVEADYIDKYYKIGPPPTFDKSHWFNEKNTLGLHFPNVSLVI